MSSIVQKDRFEGWSSRDDMLIFI